MKKNVKRILSFAMAVILLASSIAIPTVRAEGLTPLTLNEPANAVIQTGGEIAYFTFTPEKSGNYVFTSDADGDTYAELYCGGEYITGNDDGSGWNFKIIAYLETGRTYTLRARYYSADVTGNFPVTVTESPISNISVEPLVIKEYTNGEWIDNYYNYNLDSFTYTVTFSDGTEITTSENSISHDGVVYSYYIYDSQYSHNPYLAGNTYHVSFSIDGCTVSAYVTIEAAMSENGFNYMLDGDGVVITSCNRTDNMLVIPETLGGKPVTGVISLGSALKHAEIVTVPDTITSVAFLFPEWYYDSNIKVLNLGSGVSNLQMYLYARELEAINISSGNPHYTSVDGVVYDKEIKKLISYPAGKTDTHQIPDSVTDISELIDKIGLLENIDFVLGSNVADYCMEAGVLFNADKTELIWCSRNKTGSYVMPESVETIDPLAFCGSSLTEITVSPNVTEIAYGVFHSAVDLKNVHLSEGITSIGQYAFEGCSSLEVAEIPSTVTMIDYGAYNVCYNLKQVQIRDLATWCQIQFNDNPLIKARDLYLNGSKIEHLELPTSVDSVSDGAFENGSMTKLTVPSNIISIGDYVFSGSAIKEAVFSEGTQSLGYSVFAWSDLEKINLPNSLLRLGSSVFEGCGKLKDVTLGNKLTSISAYCFAETYALQVLSIPKNVTEIEYAAFQNSGLLKVDLIGENVTVGDYAFDNCPLEQVDMSGVSEFNWNSFANTDLVSVELPSSVTEITYRCFAFNDNLLSVVIPESVTSIFYNSFEDCGNLEHVLYEGTQAQWEAQAFQVELPADVKYHFEATGEDITLEFTCSEIRHYCAICDQWDTIQRKVVMHEYVNGSCKFCGEPDPDSKHGWIQEDGNWYYYKNNVAQTGWIYVNNKYYYTNANGVMQTGWLDLNDTWYYLSSSGAMQTGWLKLGDIYYYLQPSGAMVEGTVLIDGALSNFDASGVWKGYVSSGWQQLEGTWYYIGVSGKVTTEWKNIGGTYYYFNGNGEMLTGWLKSGDVYYYLQPSGAMATGWSKATDGKWYYFQSSGAMQIGWLQSGNTWYYLQISGAMATGWQKVGNTWYYFQNGGAMQTGWLQIDNVWYYFGTSGAMATGNVNIGGKVYKFAGNGVWIG